MDLSLLLTQTKTAVDIAKFIKNSSETLGKSEQKLKLAELIEALADIKMETAEIKALIIKKDERIELLENKLKLKNDLIYDAPYYFIDNHDKKKDGPYCQKCYDVDEKLIRLQEIGNDEWDCYSCNGYFQGKKYVDYSLNDSSGMYSAH